MCHPVYFAIAAMVMKGYQDYQQGKFERGVAEYNARNMENEATRTRNKGAEEENKQRRMTAELISQQKAEAAAQGVDVNSGSALQLQQDSALLGEVDALRIRSNFEDKAESLEDQAKITKAEGENAYKQGKNSFAISVIGAIGQGVGGGGSGSLSSGWFNSNSSAKIGSIANA